MSGYSMKAQYHIGYEEYLVTCTCGFVASAGRDAAAMISRHSLTHSARGEASEGVA